MYRRCLRSLGSITRLLSAVMFEVTLCEKWMVCKQLLSLYLAIYLNVLLTVLSSDFDVGYSGKVFPSKTIILTHEETTQSLWLIVG